MWEWINTNSLPYNSPKILGWTKLKASANNKSNVDRMMISFTQWMEYNVGKGEKNAGSLNFLLIP